MPEGLYRRAPQLHARKGLCQNPASEPQPYGGQAPLPPWGVHFTSGHLFAAT